LRSSSFTAIKLGIALGSGVLFLTPKNTKGISIGTKEFFVLLTCKRDYTLRVLKTLRVLNAFYDLNLMAVKLQLRNADTKASHVERYDTKSKRCTSVPKLEFGNEGA
jgi:hypothetical protein